MLHRLIWTWDTFNEQYWWFRMIFMLLPHSWGVLGGLLGVIFAQKWYFCPILTIKCSWNHVTTTYMNLRQILWTILMAWNNFHALASLLGVLGGLLAVISARKRYFCPILTIKYSWNHVTTTYVNLSHLLRTILIVWKDFQAFTSLNGGLRGRLGGLFCSEKTKLYYWMILKRCWKALCHQGVTRGVSGWKIQALCLAKMFFPDKYHLLTVVAFLIKKASILLYTWM